MYSWIDWKKEHDILKRHGESTRTIQIKVETKIKTLHLAARENQCIIKRDLQLFTAIKKKKKIEEIHEIKYKVQEMMIKSNTKEEAIDKWTAKLDEKLEKMEQPMADIEEAIKYWQRKKSIEQKTQEEQRFEGRIWEEKQIEEMRQELQKSSRIRGEDNNPKW